MTKVAIIGASYLQYPLVQKAHELGFYTLCFAWEEGAVCMTIADKFYPISIVEKEQILSICRMEQIAGVCTIASDVAAPTVAYVAEHLGLWGNTYAAAVRANNKFLMRQAFVAAGVPCPKFVCLSELANIEKTLSAAQLSLPLIVKPADRSGSLAVTRVDSEGDLLPAIEKAHAASFRHEVMVEEYIEGQEISVEFISYRGKHYPLQITDKVTTGAPHFVELEHHQPADLSPAVYKNIYAVTEQALNALELTNGASHSEYKIMQDGRLYIMEIGGRMGGDFIGSDLVQLSTGYDFLKGVLDVALGQFKEPQLIEQAHSGVYFLSAETRQVLPYIVHAADHSEIVRAEQTDTVLRRLTCSADRSGYFIYQSKHKFTL